MARNTEVLKTPLWRSSMSSRILLCVTPKGISPCSRNDPMPALVASSARQRVEPSDSPERINASDRFRNDEPEGIPMVSDAGFGTLSGGTPSLDPNPPLAVPENRRARAPPPG
ncbi:hypothetical protein ROR02_31110 [Pararhodospirillum oryzae]|uniref:Uncharacterized protein n=1 Tax=Pararhodospirillum oryzae TaxID=478448 RepID=A0A512HC65_9PROT|nr:hypothetical protein ROR02_31110 [Pararhodospirillum oryzae]